ncbi:hypothetical protein [Mesonia sp. K7]|uniref:hypothetical protein n=1 Tax=Mesonia sp. K7 TaxID=2218606 RepID=UPI000DA79E23|nr:hypothetical protein [Mesonia sp. K7]PZD78209.1 hypothetical protein DNG35_05775 [Mesonia sp. K7]
MTNPGISKQGKINAIVAYLTFVGALIAIFMNIDEKSKFATFHIRQAVGIHLFQIAVLLTVSGFNELYVVLPFWIFFFILWFYGFIGAISGNYNLIPIIGKYFQNWFNKIVP